MATKLDSVFRPKRILLIQFGPLEDVVQSLPVLNTLRVRFPRTEIAMILEDRMISLLTGHAAVDRLIVAKPHWYKSWDQIQLVRKRLQAFAPDLCFEIEGSFRGAFASWLSGAQYRVGFTKKEAKNGSWIFHNIRVPVTVSHSVEKKLALLEAIGIMGSSINYDLPNIRHEIEAANQITREYDLENVPFAMIHVTKKLQQENALTQIADYLSSKWHLPLLVLWQTDQERTLAEELVRDVSGAVTVVPELSIPLSIALIRKALLFVGSHSGPLFIASAVKTPCLGILVDPKAVPYGNTLSEWIALDSISHSLSSTFDSCDRLLKKLLPEEFQRFGA